MRLAVFGQIPEMANEVYLSTALDQQKHFAKPKFDAII